MLGCGCTYAIEVVESGLRVDYQPQISRMEHMMWRMSMSTRIRVKSKVASLV